MIGSKGKSMGRDEIENQTKCLISRTKPAGYFPTAAATTGDGEWPHKARFRPAGRAAASALDIAR